MIRDVPMVVFVLQLCLISWNERLILHSRSICFHNLRITWQESKNIPKAQIPHAMQLRLERCINSRNHEWIFKRYSADTLKERWLLWLLFNIYTFYYEGKTDVEQNEQTSRLWLCKFNCEWCLRTSRMVQETARRN